MSPPAALFKSQANGLARDHSGDAFLPAPDENAWQEGGPDPGMTAHRRRRLWTAAMQNGWSVAATTGTSPQPVTAALR